MQPAKFSDIYLLLACETLFSPRFAVEQGHVYIISCLLIECAFVHLMCPGVRDDGSIKIRAIDDCTRSGINGCTQPSIKLHVEGADHLLEGVRLVHKLTGKVPSMFKVSISGTSISVSRSCAFCNCIRLTLIQPTVVYPSDQKTDGLPLWFSNMQERL